MCLVPCGLPVAASFLFIGVLGRQHNLAVLMEVDHAAIVLQARSDQQHRPLSVLACETKFY